MTRVIAGSLETIAQAAGEVGVRSCLCYELSDRDGPEIARQGIEENVSFIRACAQKNDPMVAALFGLHASMTISAETLAAAVDPARTAQIIDRMIPTILWECGVDDPGDPTWLRADISWSTDPDVWEEARAELADVIESLSLQLYLPMAGRGGT